MRSRASLNRSVCAVIALACSLEACDSVPPLSDAKTARYSEEVGSVYVAAYPAVPWTSISEKLQPKHDLSTADARTLAAVTTQAQVSQFLSTFSAALAIGLPSRTTTSTTSIGADGVATTTGTRGLAPGTVPSSSGAPASNIGDSALAPDLTKPLAGLGLDAATQLQVGTGIYQLAKILDNQITNAINPLGYEAHLLTFQVNVQPNRRNLPYDAYINVTLLPASWEKAVSISSINAQKSDELSPIIIYPLVITDAMESSSVGKSIEVVRQAALELSGLVANAGVKAGVGGGSDKLASILGSDRNSLVTVGRISDHTLRIRLGAMQQGSRTLALVPSTHNVSVVVFTRSGDAPEMHIDKLAAITETTFVDVNTGIAVESQRNNPKSRPAQSKAVQDILDIYGYELTTQCNTPDFSSLDLVRALDRGDFGQVGECLVAKQDTSANKAVNPTKQTILERSIGNNAKPQVASSQPNVKPGSAQPLSTAEEARLRRVVAQLMTLQATSRFSKMTIELQPFKSKAPVLPSNSQLAILSDDGKSISKVTLRRAANLKLEYISAEILLKSAVGGGDAILPTLLSIDATGKELTISFPSLLASNGEDSNKQLKALLTDPIKMKVVYSPPTKAPLTSVYSVRIQKGEEDALPNPVSATTNVIVSDPTGIGKVSLLVGEWAAESLGALVLTVTGADIRAVDAPARLDAALKGIVVPQKTAIGITLGNLTSATSVQIRTTSNKKAIGTPIIFAIDRQAVPAK